MKITAITATPVAIPMSYVFRWGPGAYDGITRTLVEVETDEGISGIGESGYARDAAIVNEVFAPKLIGADPLDRLSCESQVLSAEATMRTSRDLSFLHAFCGIEMALWDIAGKATGQSLARLLGGRVRDRVEFTEYFAFEQGSAEDPTTLANSCADALATHGARVLEGKIGVLPLHEELELVASIRAAVGDQVPLRLDPNMAWDLATAKYALPALADLGVTWVEEPVMRQSDLRLLAGTAPISFSSHQIDLPLAVRDGAPNAFVIKIDYLGGIRRTVEFVAACAAFGIPVWFRAPGGGVTDAAELQVAAALEPMNQPSQTLSRWIGDNFVEQEWEHAKDGFVKVPDDPGIGVTLDRAAVERCADRARSAPLSDPYLH